MGTTKLLFSKFPTLAEVPVKIFGYPKRRKILNLIASRPTRITNSVFISNRPV